MRKEGFVRLIMLGSLAIFILAFVLVALSYNQTVSKSERRHLATVPEFTVGNILNESFMEQTEEYLLDHFPLRDSLRRIKAYFAYDILRQEQNNDIYVAKGHASKLEYPLKESSIKRLADKMTSLRTKYFPESKVYYGVIPDKNMYLASDLGYPYIDYSEISDKLGEYLDEEAFMNINLYATLTIDDYYRTDTHWKQESLLSTAKSILDTLNVGESVNLSNKNFTFNEISNFYGVYYGQSALPMEPDTITYLTNDIIEAAYVWDAEDNKVKPIYQLDLLDDDTSFDNYDIFLGGASPIEIIHSPKANTDKRLVIFRDSYTSSLAPLLLEAYSEIDLIDLRYISSEIIGEYVDFEGADIMFLYGVSVINNSSGLK